MFKRLNNIIAFLFWKPVYEHSSLLKYYHKKLKPFEHLTPQFEDSIINKSFKEDNQKWFHNEYLYEISDCLIEPSHRICINGLRTLIFESMSNTNERPSLRNYILFLLSVKKTINVSEVIQFDGASASNYFHFFSDIINKIWLLDKFNIDESIPIIISRKTFESTYFNYLYHKYDLKKRTWVLQGENTWIKARKLLIVKAFPYEKSYFEKTVKLVKPVMEKSNNRIFITRSAKIGRNILNMSEIEKVLNKYDFIITDTENMSFEKQMKTFASAELVIGIHGASITNLIFSDWERVKFIEIMPANCIACKYYWLSETLGIRYDIIRGSDLNKHNSFSVSPVLLEKALLKLLKN
ncbi:MAG: glycosyltransferase family 61 protein [Bacteroidales bacterium]|nr:glycosyltransferase family 61 protein [Bacteroidales bacterium]